LAGHRGLALSVAAPAAAAAAAPAGPSFGKFARGDSRVLYKMCGGTSDVGGGSIRLEPEPMVSPGCSSGPMQENGAIATEEAALLLTNEGAGPRSASDTSGRHTAPPQSLIRAKGSRGEAPPEQGEGRGGLWPTEGLISLEERTPRPGPIGTQLIRSAIGPAAGAARGCTGGPTSTKGTQLACTRMAPAT
jgi:hypothetical protein